MRVLVVQTSFLGDVILTTPLTAAIKKRLPTAEIFWLCTPAALDLLSLDPEIKQVITFDKHSSEAGIIGILRKLHELRSYKFDLAYGIQRSLRTTLLLALAGIPLRIGFKCASANFLYQQCLARDPQKHEVERNLSILGKYESSDFTLKLVSQAEPAILKDLESFGIAPHNYIVLAPGSAWPTKMWKWQGFREVAEWFIKRAVKVVLLGSAQEVKLCNQVAENLDVINLCGKISLQQMMSVVKKAKLLLCNDSMALHMASAFHVPTVAVFCATSPSFGFGPWQNEKALVVELEGLECKPCRRHGSNICPSGTNLCMQGLHSDVVIKAIEKLVKI